MSFWAEGSAEDVAKGKLTLTTLREKMAAVVERRAVTDPNIRYIDGLTLYGEEDNKILPLPDALHPDGKTHALIGRRFAEQVFSIR